MPIYKKGDTVIVNDKMQTGYKYVISEDVGSNFDESFKPDLTPKEILELGAFGGVYMRDCKKEFPDDWFVNAKFALEGPDASENTNEHIAELNFFGVNASQPLSVWRAKGWIYKDDPRGWFQWYCRYYIGRRIPEEDARQIKRWRAMIRHIAQIKKNCLKGDFTCHRKQRQALLHWAYDSRKF